MLECDRCRSRKTRCDGQTPCATCRTTDWECTYEMEAPSKGKSDLILAAVLRVERLLKQRDTCIIDSSHRAGFQSPNGDMPSASAPYSMPTNQRDTVEVPLQKWLHSVQNASLSPLHISTTENILAWPHFDCYPLLREAERVSIFNLEQGRAPSAGMELSPVLPFISIGEIEAITMAFEQNINFWYPTMSKGMLDQLKDKLSTGRLSNDCNSCLALLVMALSCACEFTVSTLRDDLEGDTNSLPRRKKMGEMYFDCAMNRMHIPHQEVSRAALHCLLFTAFYFAFSQRPLQAWSFIDAAATKCRVLLAYRPAGISQDEQECIHRIFWSCFILERFVSHQTPYVMSISLRTRDSDYIAELSALPLSGISDMESSVPLPGQFHTHTTVEDEEHSAMYFLACLSMRRLLNRVHHLLYSKDTGASLDDRRFPHMVTELDHQLEDWRRLLPPVFSFTLNKEPAPNSQAGFLRQRYLTCRSVIYRPYLMQMLNPSGRVDQEGWEKCKKCLDACIEHILNLRSFPHTVFVDTWICSLSMAGAMLVLLAGCRIPGVQQYIYPEVTMLGSHLQSLLSKWITIPGEPPSPSVKQAIRWIEVTDRLIKGEQ
ncbi:Fungal Zn2-Cys6 binuclear cluster domain-containing protein isoform 8 [Cladophialophora immunda]|nr:Fungal Zn2-Cys6 binuclear cluster domain-containing protein isoform 8 [Cladophialophora immunda]